MSSQTEIARVNMIKQQLRTNDVLDDDLLRLIASIPREEFVPPEYRAFAFADMHIPIGHDQVMMTPVEESQLLVSMNIRPTDTVLEIGTGTGYLTSLLAKLAKRVITIDYYSDFTEAARRRLTALDIENVQFITGDACRGWLDLAPYDVIISTGGHKRLPSLFVPQLTPQGRMFAIVGQAPVMTGERCSLDANGHWQKSMVFETCLPLLIDRGDKGDFVF